MSQFNFGDIVVLIFVVLFGYFFSSMRKILYGTWFKIRPTWKWGEDIKKLKLLASQADSLEVRQRCKYILYGIYFSVGFLILGCIVGALL